MGESTEIAEIWKPVPGFGGRYEASTEGHVRSVRLPGTRLAGVVLRPTHASAYGYLAVQLVPEGEPSKSHYVHALVASTFMGERPGPDMEINHKYGNRENNRPGNLEYVSKSENGLHAAEVLGRHRGEANGYAKLTAGDVRAIRALAGQVTVSVIAARFGITQGYASAVINRKTWRHLAA